MMTIMQEIIKANERYRAAEGGRYDGEDPATAKLPSRRLAIVACMDTRLVTVMEKAMGIGRGEAHIIKVAGNVVEPLGDVVRSLLVSIYELGVRHIIVVGHEGCGMEKTTAHGLALKMQERGIAEPAIAAAYDELQRWADGFTCSTENVRNAVRCLREHPLLPKDITVDGCSIHPSTGVITEITA